MHCDMKKDKIQNDCIKGDIGVALIKEKTRIWLRWLGHMQRMSLGPNDKSIILHGF